jgi:hypothetical protein
VKLQLRTGTRGQFPAQAAPTGDVLLGAPTKIGGGPSATGAAATKQVTGDDQQITLTTGNTMPPHLPALLWRRYDDLFRSEVLIGLLSLWVIAQAAACLVLMG